jgi:hypothetical protein
MKKMLTLVVLTAIVVAVMKILREQNGSDSVAGDPGHDATGNGRVSDPVAGIVTSVDAAMGSAAGGSGAATSEGGEAAGEDVSDSA